MKHLRLAFLLGVALSGGATLSGCASAPAGFTLGIQLRDVQMSAVDNVRLVLAPQAVGGTMARFTAPTMTSFEDGGVMLSVDDDGQLVILISGAYFQANAVPIGEGDLDPRLDLELWSDDATMRVGPQITGVVVAGGFESATGAAYLPSWPLPLGTEFTLTLPCTAGREAECRPAP